MPAGTLVGPSTTPVAAAASVPFSLTATNALWTTAVIIKSRMPSIPEKSAVESEDMQAFFAENPNFRTAVEQLPMTQPQDSARVFIPNGDQIIGAGLERIVINHEEPQPVFDEVAATLTEEAQPVLESIAALAG